MTATSILTLFACYLPPAQVTTGVPWGMKPWGVAIAWHFLVVRVSTLSKAMCGSCLNQALAAPGCIPICLLFESSRSLNSPLGFEHQQQSCIFLPVPSATRSAHQTQAGAHVL